MLFRYAEVRFLIASVTGYCTALINSFILNSRWTFNSTAVGKEIEFANFVSVNLVALLANVLSLRYIVSFLNIPPEIAQIFAIDFSLVINFMGNKYWTFQETKKESGQ